MTHKRTPQGWHRQKQRHRFQNQYYDKKKREIVATERIPPHRRTVRSRNGFRRKLYVEHRPPAFPGDVLHDHLGQGLYDLFVKLDFREAFFNP